MLSATGRMPASHLTDISDEEWSFAAPCLTLMDQHAPQREHDPREFFNAMRELDTGCFKAKASAT